MPGATQRMRQGELASLEFCFIRVKGGVLKVLWIHALLMNLKPKRRIKAH